MRNTILLSLLLSTSAACMPCLPKASADTFVIIADVCEEPGTTGDITCETPSSQWGACINGACDEGLFCMETDAGSVCIAPCGGDDCTSSCGGDALCNAAGACVMTCTVNQACPESMVCDDQLNVCIWPTNDPPPTCVAVPNPGEFWGPCVEGECNEGFCKNTKTGDVCTPACDNVACEPFKCFNGTCRDDGSCVASCSEDIDCPLPGQACDAEIGICVYPSA